MSDNTTTTTTATSSSPVKQSRRKSESASMLSQVLDTIFLTLRHWPLILISVAICFGGTYFYLLRIPDVYTRYTEILVKDETGAKSAVADAFSDIRMVKAKTNIENEITTFTSNDIMDEVVRRGHFDINYFIKGKFRDKIAYGENLPVNVAIEGLQDDTRMSFNLEVAKNGDVTLSDMEKEGRSAGSQEFTGKLNKAIRTPYGNVTVMPTQSYRKGDVVELFINKVPVSRMRAHFLGSLNVVPTGEKSTILRLTLTDQSIERADAILNYLFEVYGENWIRDRNQISVATSNFIGERLGVIERELGSVENDISSYKSNNLITDVESSSSAYIQQSQQSAEAIKDLNNKLAMARNVRRTILSDVNRDQLLLANSEGSQSVQSLISEYNSMMIQRNSLIAKSSDRNPLVAQLDHQLEQMRTLMVRTIDNEILNLNNQVRTLQSTEASALSKLASNPKQAKYLLSVERQQKVKESLYLYLLQKREENELTQAFTAYNTRMVSSPTAAPVAPSPNRSRTLAIALAVGLLLPFAITYLLQMLNTKVRGRKDLEDLTVPFLGEVPLYGKNREKQKFGRSKFTRAIVIKNGSRDVINEAFRVFRTNLEFMKIHKDEADVVAITSFNPGSGKSFLAVNLGMSLALKGRKVLIIDGDMRHRSTSQYVDTPAQGLSGILNGSVADYRSVLVKDKLTQNLDVLAVGAVPPNPTELLETAYFSNLLAEVRKHYDYVLIDCPPIEVVADAQIIDKLADRTLFVVRAGLLERSMLPELDRLYEDKKFKNMVIVLNGTTASAGYGRYGRYGYRYGYSYGYGHGYGYGYGYANPDVIND